MINLGKSLQFLNLIARGGYIKAGFLLDSFTVREIRTNLKM